VFAREIHRIIKNKLKEGEEEEKIIILFKVLSSLTLSPVLILGCFVGNSFKRSKE